MKQVRHCDECHEELPGTAPEGLCPRCLLKQGGLELGIAVRQRDALVAVTRANATPPRFGNYEVLEKIGQGGMGTVYKARQLNLDRMVALKLLPFGAFSRPEVVQRFRSEATAAAALQHPNIVAVHDVGEQDGQPYFSMDFVEGRTLAELVRDQPLSARRAAAYLKTIAEAVYYAHQQGIVHRDLKPSNIVIDGFDQPRITDFGLAKRLTSSSDLGLLGAHLTLTGQVLGSPNFISPEQAEGRSEAIGPASDIYSLGAMVYHLLTRQPPFQAETLTTLLKQVIESDPVPPRLLNPSIPRDLETICLKCLEKETLRRYSTAQKLADDLGRFLEQKPILARPVGVVSKAWKWCRRRPALAGMALAFLASVVLGLAGVLWQWHRATVGENLARQNAEAETQQRRRAEAGEYAADMQLAQTVLEENDRAVAISLLDKYRPEGEVELRAPKSNIDRRGWEWRYLWQLCRGEELRVLHQYASPISSLAVSKDGKLLAVRTGDQVALWDLTTERPLAELTNAVAEGLAFSPVEDLLAMGSRDANGQPTLVLWDVHVGVARTTLRCQAEIRSVAFSPDGKRIATFDDLGGVAIKEVASGQSLASLIVPAPVLRPCGVVAFSPDGSTLAIGEDYGGLTLLDWRTGIAITNRIAESGVMALVFSPAGDLLATSYAYPSTELIRLWDARTGQACGQLTNHTSDVNALAFTRDGRRLISASADGTIRIWDAARQTELRCLQSFGDGLLALALLPDGKTLVSGGYKCCLSVWDAEGGNRPVTHTNLNLSSGYMGLAMLGGPDSNAFYRAGIAYAPDGRTFITMNSDGSVGSWEAWPVRPAQHLPELGTNNWSVALSPDGHWLAVGNASKIQFWDWRTRTLRATGEAPFEWAGVLRFSNNGKFAVARFESRSLVPNVSIWRTGTWDVVPPTTAQGVGIYSIDFSPDELHLAAGYTDGSIKLWSLPGGECESTLRREGVWVTGVFFLENGRKLVSTTVDGTVQLWDILSGKEYATFPRHPGGIWSAALSRDGQRLVTAGTTPKHAVTLWDLASHRDVLSLSADGAYFLDVTFSSAGDTIVATALKNGRAYFWHAPSWEQIQAEEKMRGGP